MQERDRARAGPKVVHGILGIDPALDRVPANHDVILPEAQGQSLRDPDLFADQVNAGHHLGDSVLDLDAGVHFNEIVAAVPIRHELDGAGVHTARRAGGGQGRGAHLPAQFRAQGAGRRLLDELLVPPLDGALAVSELDHVSVGVCEDLKFDVSGVLDLLFEVELPVSEAGARLLEELRQFIRAAHTPDPEPAASGGGLDQDRPAHGFRDSQRLVRVSDRSVGSRYHRDAGCLHPRPGGCLPAHLPDHFRGRPDKGQSGRLARLGELRGFREKPIAGVDGLAAGRESDGQQRLRVQIAVSGAGRPNTISVLRQLDRKGVPVRLGTDDHRGYIQFAAGTLYAQGDLSAVRDQNTAKHAVTLSCNGSALLRKRRRRRPLPGSRGSGSRRAR